MVRSSTLVRLLARQIREPELIVAALNDELSADNPSLMFCTLICAVFEKSTRRLTLANGGHTRPVLLRPGQAPAWAVPACGTALGFEPGLTFPRTELSLQPGDAVVFYTDGVNEAFNPHSECYGNDRLLADLAPATGSPATDIVSGLLRDVRAFAAGAPQSDDIAVLTLHLPA